jgi:hypothetical protein
MNVEHWTVCVQPNRKLAIFSRLSNSMVVVDATQAEVRAFFRAEASQAVERIVGRQLASARLASWADLKATHLSNATAVRNDPELAEIISKL